MQKKVMSHVNWTFSIDWLFSHMKKLPHEIYVIKKKKNTFCYGLENIRLLGEILVARTTAGEVLTFPQKHPVSKTEFQIVPRSR